MNTYFNIDDVNQSLEYELWIQKFDFLYNYFGMYLSTKIIRIVTHRVPSAGDFLNGFELCSAMFGVSECACADTPCRLRGYVNNSTTTWPLIGSQAADIHQYGSPKKSITQKTRERRRRMALQLDHRPSLKQAVHRETDIVQRWQNLQVEHDLENDTQQ